MTTTTTTATETDGYEPNRQLVFRVRNGPFGFPGRPVSAGKAASRLTEGSDLSVTLKWSYTDGTEYAAWAEHIPARFGGRFGGDCGFAELPGSREPVIGGYEGTLSECRRCGMMIVNEYSASDVRPSAPEAGMIYDIGSGG